MHKGTLWSVAFLSLACSSQKCQGTRASSAGDATTVILKLKPEDMTFESDSRFDGSGRLVVEVFDTPHPFKSPARARALYEGRFPAAADAGKEVSLRALPEPRLTLHDAPATLYVRVTFFDDAQASASKELLSPGTWYGGVDLSGGVFENRGLLPLPVTRGAVQTASINLVALRALSVTVTASAKPLGDGEGPMAVVVRSDPDATHNAPLLALGGLQCAKVADMPMTLVVPLIAPGGTYYVAGFLNDLGFDSEIAPGELAAMEIGDAGTAVFPAKLALAQRDYTPSASIDLSFRLSPPSDGVVPPNSCADIPAKKHDTRQSVFSRHR
ncbi:MAG TPA: hypothetical protein VI072_35045 [Polyangiaceae bacterium]